MELRGFLQALTLISIVVAIVVLTVLGIAMLGAN